MEKIRLGIVGMGNMGNGHFQNVLDGSCPSVRVSAICDIDPDRLKGREDIACFTDSNEMMDSGLVDAILIVVPHYSHPTIAIEAFKRGLHVLVEKPAGVYARQVRQMNEEAATAAAKAGVKFGIMFNQRTNPVYKRARDIVQSGQLGELKRLVWIITNWYRTQAYYDSGTWRASWQGEGGGVLLNQAPHNLDLWQWIFGMPKRVRAFCSTGKYHRIAVEDDVTIFGEYDNGATATFITTTGEAPGTNRLEISGDRGKIVIENGKLTWWKLAQSEREICFTAKEGFVTPETSCEEFTAEEPNGHARVLEAFAQAILNGTDLIARGEEGLNSLSISNAAYLSSWTHDWADIPTDEELFEKHLSQLCSMEKQNPPKKA